MFRWELFIPYPKLGGLPVQTFAQHLRHIIRWLLTFDPLDARVKGQQPADDVAQMLRERLDRQAAEFGIWDK